METQQLKLTAEHFPLHCSLREPVLDHYATTAATSLKGPAMDQRELIGYLRTTERLELSPLQSVLSQAEVAGDTSRPTAEQAAILNWLADAFTQWETDFPLEETLASQLRRLKPLAAALAISDPDFLTPGLHPLHMMLDKIHLATIGWQARLGRVGEGPRKQLLTAVEDALAWFETAGFDLTALCARVISVTERDLARANRMILRTIETERGRLKTAQAKRVAAEMINRGLAEYRIPPGIDVFLRGPWYDNAQLVLLKFGAESKQWAHISETTTTLLDSLQPPEEGDSGQRRQQLFEIITRLPRELRRCLFDSQQLNDAVEEGIKTIESAHMEILRKQSLELEQGELIPVDAPHAGVAYLQGDETIRTDQWFLVDRGEDSLLRVRLVSPVEGSAELLFANQAGIRVFQQRAEDFARLLGQGKAIPLDSGASFSRSLAYAAGIKTSTELDTLLRETALPLPIEEEEVDAGQLQREWDEALQRKREREAAAQVSEPHQPGRTEGQALSLDAGPEPTPGDLATGTWLGFHDGDAPLLARLAVHDSEQNTYVFVNRSGIQVRELGQEELASLMAKGLVDVLETRSPP